MSAHKLVLAEKPSVAKSIAAVLNANKREDGFFIGNNYIISWCAGHLLGLAAPEAYGDYAKWRYADLPIIPETWKHTPLKGKTAQLKIIKDLMNRADVDCIINACDAGREGENIFRLVYEYAKCKKKIMRLWVSSMEDAAIRAGFDNLIDGAKYDNLAAAASCRECADWAVGINCTRAFSVLHNGKLNVGRVQSPTLAMLVKREADIAGFIKEPFYMPTIDLNSFIASGDRLKDKTAAEVICVACDGKTATLLSVERQKKTAAPPKLYDLTALQREANRLFGFTAAQTLEYAQSLYERKILTYPRVDSRYLTSHMRETAQTMAAWLQNNTTYAGSVSFTPDIDRLINDSKVSDHHAIIPTAEIFKTDLAALPSGDRDIVNLVAVRMLAATAPMHSFEAVTAVFDCGGHTFTAKGKTVLTDGWKAIDTAFKATLKTKPDSDEGTTETDCALPRLSEGQTFNGVTVTIKEGTTTPPKHFTEDTLLSAMENAGNADFSENIERRGLGTPATRAATIEKIIKSGFVIRSKKNLLPTDTGKSLIAVLPDALTSPMLTAEWEYKLGLVEKGELDGGAFMDGIAEFTKAIVTENNAPKSEFAELFGDKKAAAEPLGACPRCGAPIHEGKTGFFCDTQSCGFKLWKNSKFWTAKKKPLTAAIVRVLLKDGRVALKGLYSEKTGKKYDAIIVLDDSGGQFINFKMNFSNV